MSSYQTQMSLSLTEYTKMSFKHKHLNPYKNFTDLSPNSFIIVYLLSLPSSGTQTETKHKQKQEIKIKIMKEIKKQNKNMFINKKQKFKTDAKT